jgi:hypothetical protein
MSTSKFARSARPTIGLITSGSDPYRRLHQGVIDLIAHHGYRRITYIRGPEGYFEANARYQAYLDALQAHDLPHDPQLVFRANAWGQQRGTDAVHAWQDERHLDPGRDFEAIFAATDGMAVGAWQALRQRGYWVPTDVDVVGNDDAEDKDHVFRQFSLTTVHRPTYALGWQATERLLALLNGEPVPHHVTVATPLRVRMSCGCTGAPEVRAAAHPIAAQPGLPEHELGAVFRTHRRTACTAMREAVSASVDGSPDHVPLVLPDGRAERLWDALVHDIVRETVPVPDVGASHSGFLRTVGGLLHAMVLDGGDDAVQNNSTGYIHITDSTLTGGIGGSYAGRVSTANPNTSPTSYTEIGTPPKPTRAVLYDVRQAPYNAPATLGSLPTSDASNAGGGVVTCRRVGTGSTPTSPSRPTWSRAARPRCSIAARAR